MCYYEADSLREVEEKERRHPRGWLCLLEGGREGRREGGEASVLPDTTATAGGEGGREGGRGGMAFYVSSHKSHDNPPTEYVFTLVPLGGELSKWKVREGGREGGCVCYTVLSLLPFRLNSPSLPPSLPPLRSPV
jgi:hypothetical protein